MTAGVVNGPSGAEGGFHMQHENANHTCVQSAEQADFVDSSPGIYSRALRCRLIYWNNWQMAGVDRNDILPKQ